MQVLKVVKVVVGITVMRTRMRMPCILRTLKKVPMRVTARVKKTSHREVIPQTKVRQGPLNPSIKAQLNASVLAPLAGGVSVN